MSLGLVPFDTTFQFTLPRGERLSVTNFLSSYSLFQFTLPRGERLGEDVARAYDELFQFTLPRGERPILIASLPAPFGFNSRSREGSDVKRPPKPVNLQKFQFTLPRGERPISCCSPDEI